MFNTDFNIFSVFSHQTLCLSKLQSLIAEKKVPNSFSRQSLGKPQQCNFSFKQRIDCIANYKE